MTNRIKAEFGTRFVNAEVKVETLGNTAGWASFCQGEADVLQTTRPATGDELQQCAGNGIESYTIDLGREALVFAVPPALDAVVCVTAEDVSKLLAAGSEDAPAPVKWNAINPDWPDLDLMLILPSMSTAETDYLTATLLRQLNFVVRMDVVEKDDALYRAQGVVNAGNALTYLWWSAFQGSQSGARLLSVDAGSGCVAPSPETFADGSYALSYPVQYVFSKQSFANPLLRALLWHFFDQTSLDVFADHPFAGRDLEALGGAKKDEVFDMLAEYQKTAPPPGEATPEATEPAPSATEAVTPAATEAAPAGTEAVTPAATEAATEAVTPAATEAATEAAQ
jgi:phosphate transport system substrate-binding protein